MSKGRKLLVLGVVIGACAAPQAASAAPPASVFGGAVPCTVQGDGVTCCSDDARAAPCRPSTASRSTSTSAFPAEAQHGPRPYPLMMMFHGYGGGKLGLAAMRRWLDRGYATFSMTDRGFRESCGSAASKAAGGAACDAGYVRLIDNRYEVRDAQEFAGQLADANLVDPQRIGAIGGSYGGGMSMALGALRNRKVMPDYSLVPWTSPGGKPMQIAAAAPNIPWTDLAYSLAPNGSTLDYVADAPYSGRVGVAEAVVRRPASTSPASARPASTRPQGSDPTADLVGWRALLDAGEPYGADVLRRSSTSSPQHHSSYYIDHSIATGADADVERVHRRPVPGRRDDPLLQPHPDASTRRTRTWRCSSATSATRAARTRTTSSTRWTAAENAWMDYYVKGVGSQPADGRHRLHRDLPGHGAVGRPVHGDELGEDREGRGPVRVEAAEDDRADRRQTRRSRRRSTRSSAAAPARRPTAPISPGPRATGSIRRPTGGYTLIGSPTVIAKFTLPGDTSQVAARLLDVGPDGQETLVARGLWRPATGGPTEQVFQLHPNGWKFAEGHVPKLELLPADASAGHRRLRARVERPAAGDGEAARAAPAGGREAGLARGPGRRSGGEVPARRATSSRPTSRRSRDRHPKLSEEEARRSRARSWSASSPARPSSPPATTSRRRPRARRAATRRSSRSPRASSRRFAGGKLEDAEAEADRQGQAVLPRQHEAEADGRDQLGRGRRADESEGEGGREAQVDGTAPARSAEVGAGGDRARRPRWRPRARSASRSPRCRSAGSAGPVPGPVLRPAEAAGGSSPLSCSSSGGGVEPALAAERGAGGDRVGEQPGAQRVAVRVGVDAVDQHPRVAGDRRVPVDQRDVGIAGRERGHGAVEAVDRDAVEGRAVERRDDQAAVAGDPPGLGEVRRERLRRRRVVVRAEVEDDDVVLRTRSASPGRRRRHRSAARSRRRPRVPRRRAASAGRAPCRRRGCRRRRGPRPRRSPAQPEPRAPPRRRRGACRPSANCGEVVAWSRLRRVGEVLGEPQVAHPVLARAGALALDDDAALPAPNLDALPVRGRAQRLEDRRNRPGRARGSAADADRAPRPRSPSRCRSGSW